MWLVLTLAYAAVSVRNRFSYITGRRWLASAISLMLNLDLYYANIIYQGLSLTLIIVPNSYIIILNNLNFTYPLIGRRSCVHIYLNYFGLVLRWNIPRNLPASFVGFVPYIFLTGTALLLDWYSLFWYSFEYVMATSSDRCRNSGCRSCPNRWNKLPHACLPLLCSICSCSCFVFFL